MSSIHQPLVSIVTPSFNQRRYIEQMLQSVGQQDYPQIEHIVIDGGSTDGTVELLEAAGNNLTWISEPDNGQAAAINKGFLLAKGEIFGWLNCDDLYTCGAIRTVVEYFVAHKQAMLLFGDALAIDAKGHSYGLRKNVGPCTFRTLVHSGDFIVQPATFWRATLWRQLGPLDESLHYALDYEYWMRAAKHYPLHYIPRCLARERLHQEAKTNTGYLKRINEIYNVACHYGAPGYPYYFRAEAASIHYWQAFQELKSRQWQNFRHHIRITLSLRPQPLKFLIYLFTLFLFGPRSIATLRLWANRLLSWRRPIYPSAAVNQQN